MNQDKKTSTKSIAMLGIFVIGIIVIGISISYAFYSINMTGNSDMSQSTAAQLDFTTNLTSVSEINTTRLQLLDVTNSNFTELVTDKVTFTVTNQNTSNINGKYTLNLKEMSISKNLSSQYFKWAVVVSGTNTKTITGNFLDASGIAPEGTTDKTEISNLSKVLIDDENALTLEPGQTDTITFYIWLENAAVDQIYLTSGSFSGKLSLDAVPSK